MEKVLQELFWVHFFGCPYRSSGTKINLDAALLLKGVSVTIQNEVKEQKRGFLSMLLGTLGTSLLGNILARKGINRAGKGIVRAGYGNKKVTKTTTKNKKNFQCSLIL